MQTWCSTRTWLSGVLFALLLPGCPKSSTQEPSTDASECASLPELGWLTWLLKDPKGPEALQGSGGGWIALYQRSYREALEKFEGATGPQAELGQIRTHISLGTLHLDLARLLARAQTRYFEHRAQLGPKTKRLVHGPYFRGVAETLLGQKSGPKRLNALKRLPAPYPALGKAFPAKCVTEPAKGKNAWAVFASVARCASTSLPTCPAGLAPPKLKGDWSNRAHAYYQALCDDPIEVDGAALLEWAQTPAATETVQAKTGGEAIETEAELYDPMALWALGQLHLRKAQALAERSSAPNASLLKAWAQSERKDPSARASLKAGRPENGGSGSTLEVVLSDWMTAQELKSDIERRLENQTATLAMDAVRQAAEKRKEEVALAMKCAATENPTAKEASANNAGQKFVTDLGLGTAAVDGLIRRRTRGTSHDPKQCDGGLRLLRSTLDTQVTDRISFRNEPQFLVQLAQAALCMGRSSEAIGALRAVREGYPEASGVLKAVESLVVVRLIGGTGEQKTQ